MKSIQFLYSCLFLLISVYLPGQKEIAFQQVFLIDGNVLRGEVIAERPEQVTIQTISGAVFYIERQHIKKITEISKDQTLLPNGKTLNSGNLYTHTFWGLLLSKEESWQGEAINYGYSILHISMGHRFNPYLCVGGGMSWDQYDVTLFSLFGELTGSIAEQALSPYYSIRGGYGVPLFNTSQEEYKLGGGYLIHPAIGFRFATAGRTNIMIEMGYRFQQFQRKYEDFFDTTDRITNRRLSLRFGLDF